MKKAEISKILGIDNKTLYNWEKTRPELFKIVTEYFEKEKRPDLNDKEFLKEEINKAIDQVPQGKAKKLYHMIMAELAELE